MKLLELLQKIIKITLLDYVFVIYCLKDSNLGIYIITTDTLAEKLEKTTRTKFFGLMKVNYGLLIKMIKHFNNLNRFFFFRLPTKLDLKKDTNIPRIIRFLKNIGSDQTKQDILARKTID